MSSHFQTVFNLHASASEGVADAATEDIWNNIKTGLLKLTEEVCVTTPFHQWHGDGMSTWKRPLQPSEKLLRHGVNIKKIAFGNKEHITD